MRNSQHTGLPSTHLPWCLHGPYGPSDRSHGHQSSVLYINPSLPSAQCTVSRTQSALRLPDQATSPTSHSVRLAATETTRTQKTRPTTQTCAPERLPRLRTSHAHSLRATVTRRAASSICLALRSIYLPTHTRKRGVDLESPHGVDRLTLPPTRMILVSGMRAEPPTGQDNNWFCSTQQSQLRCSNCCD